MRRQKFFISLAAIAMLLFVSVVASAQNGDLRGHVTLTQADGTTVPVANATIDIFRVDIAGKWNVKTNKKGEFVYVGLPYVGTYLITASAPNAQPTFVPNVKVGRDIDYSLQMSPGDGKRLTEAEAKAASTRSQTTSSGGESAEDKKKREEIEAKNREIEEKNKNIGEANAIVARTFKAGNELRAAHKYDEAIAQYDEGLKADPQQVALWIGKAESYRMHGVERYNAAVQNTDAAAKASGMEAAKKDFAEAAAAGQKAVETAKAEGAASTDPAQQTA
ncbi:MAG: carboxypeptidase regulatory-like domain-containing protein, partial [Pyrinomonadaceae bacterium]